jgi:hypothetical protein
MKGRLMFALPDLDSPFAVESLQEPAGQVVVGLAEAVLREECPLASGSSRCSPYNAAFDVYHCGALTVAPPGPTVICAGAPPGV